MQQLLYIYPELPALHYNLGNLYRDNGQFGKAIVQYRESVVLKPDFIQAINNQAGLYIARADYSKALTLLKQIAAMQPDDPDIYVDIARVYATQKQTKESIVWLKTAIEKGFSNWELLQTDLHLDILKNTTDYQDFLKNLRSN